MEDFFKFPRTSHVMNMGAATRDDLVMDKKDLLKFLSNDIILEEKVDGANLGISITEDFQILFQNRSHHVTTESATQWKQLDHWKSNHSTELFEILSPNLVLFGEWCYSKHSIHYTRLPDYFLAFDIYDKEKQKFYSVEARDKLLSTTTIKTVPLVAKGKFTSDQLSHLLRNRPSSLYDGPMEGIYLRVEADDNKSNNNNNNGNGNRNEKERYLVQRGKIVREDFLGAGDNDDVVHWSKRELIKNIVVY